MTDGMEVDKLGNHILTEAPGSTKALCKQAACATPIGTNQAKALPWLRQMLLLVQSDASALLS
jgi:hypothetical protein